MKIFLFYFLFVLFLMVFLNLRYYNNFLPDTTKFVEINVPPHINSNWFPIFLYTATFHGADPRVDFIPFEINNWGNIIPQSRKYL